jgi:hypothetical protein
LSHLPKLTATPARRFPQQLSRVQSRQQAENWLRLVGNQPTIDLIKLPRVDFRIAMRAIHSAIIFMLAGITTSRRFEPETP